MAKIKLGFSGFVDADLLVKASNIINCMTGNTYFANPVPPLADIQTAIDAFDTALANMAPGNKENTLIKNNCRVVLEALLTDLGLFCQLHSKGNELMLATSGFELVSKPSPVGVLPKPENFSVKTGKARGSIKVSMKAINGAKSYTYEYTAAPITSDSIWQYLTEPRASIVIDNLVSGKEYYFKAVGVGASQTRVYSDVISSFVL